MTEELRFFKLIDQLKLLIVFIDVIVDVIDKASSHNNANIVILVYDRIRYVLSRHYTERIFLLRRDTVEEKSGTDITEMDGCSVHRNGISVQQLPQLITSRT